MKRTLTTLAATATLVAALAGPAGATSIKYGAHSPARLHRGPAWGAIKWSGVKRYRAAWAGYKG